MGVLILRSPILGSRGSFGSELSWLVGSGFTLELRPGTPSRAGFSAQIMAQFWAHGFEQRNNQKEKG